MEKGTLEELNVKAGDVVKCLEGTGMYFDEGQTETITNDMMINTKMGLLDVDIPAHTFTIVSRASDTLKLEGDSPTLWRDMTPEEKGALLLAKHEGKEIEVVLFGNAGERWASIEEPQFSSIHAYRIKPSSIVEPKVETVVLKGYLDRGYFHVRSGVNDTHSITFNAIDGKPDPATIKMEEI